MRLTDRFTHDVLHPELAAVLRENDQLRRRLCHNTKTYSFLVKDFQREDTVSQLAEKLLDACDYDRDGVIKPHELERAIRGWAKIDWEKAPNHDELDREHQLKGAAERARIEAELSGGFKGLTSKVEALNIGRAAQDFHAKWFTMFANIPKDERGKVTAPRLASAIERNHFLRARLVENAKIDASKFDDSKDGNAFVDLAEALLAVIDTNANGEIEPHELERVIRGWEKVDYTPTQTWETDRAHQLAGAAERARIRAEMAGGFTGLSREEALRIGESAQDFHEKWFTMFANIDVDKDGSIDRAELTKALEKNDFLRRTICKNLGFSPMESRRSKAKELGEKLIGLMDDDGSGKIEPMELERAIRGWAKVDWKKTNTEESDRAHQLAGAAERARIEAERSGGYVGLTDAEEALRIGESAQDFHEKWFTLFANLDVDKSGAVDRKELAKALSTNDFLRNKLIVNANLVGDTPEAREAFLYNATAATIDPSTMLMLADAIIQKVDDDGSGKVEPAELERAIRGWVKVDYAKTNTHESDRAHQLKGAAERARIEAERSGGYVGLTDAEEALRVGDSMQDFHEKWFTLFANLDVDKDGSIDKNELAIALGKNDFLRNKLIQNAKIDHYTDDAMDDLAEKVLAAIDDDGDGTVGPAELERAIRGWMKTDYTPTQTEASTREHMLKGAAERARIEAELSGGYFGLLDPEEARRIGEKMQDFHEKWFTLFANVDVDRDGTINVAELSKALGMNDFLRNKLIENAKIETSPSETMETLAEKVLRAVDDDGSGKIEPRELERAIRGWTKVDWTAIQTFESDRAHQLAGAAERARIEAELSGGYLGLLDAEEAKAIGDKMQDFHEKWFTLFANIDVDKSGFVDEKELARALAINDFLRVKLCEGAKIETSAGGESMEDLAGKLLRAVDDDGDGKIEPRELERAIRGWTKFDWRATNTEESDRAHQLAGAAERAKIRRDEIGGGFAGITDAEEALQIGDAARGFNATERAQFADTEGAFADGAAFALNPELKAKRSEEEAVIKAELKEEGMLNKVGEDFKGLDADEALRVGENVKLGGELLEFDF